jgi:V8-like Glu-specific endopeptidase
MHLSNDVKIKNKAIYYDIDTSEGQSGSPIFIENSL